MFGTAGKSGRGGKRKLKSNFRSATLNRPSGRNNRITTATPVITATAPAEETYSLVTGNPLDFAMIIKLTPDLVDEIKRAESQGGSARIKFHAIANNSSGNVIDVGGKDFRFTWSREMGDLCDIYEERQSGEDGNGLLVESGCAWRKLNVQRVLDESTKNHVKMRSEEAERKSKSRKVTILDNGSSSLKSQMKALAAAEATPWKMPLKQKKEPPCKKRKDEPPPGPPKSYKHMLSTRSKGRTSSLLLPSAHDQPHASASPFGTGNLGMGYASVEDNMPIQITSKGKPSSFEKGTPDRVITNAEVDKLASKGDLGVKPTDLRSMLIFLLAENPRGMSLKALEKTVGQNFPDAGRQIKHIIKKIATYQPPGRYILKSGAELESLQKPVHQIGSSLENNQQQTSGTGEKCDDIYDPVNNASVKTHTQNDEPANLNSVPGEVLTDAEEINIPIQSPDHYAEKKVLDDREGLVATSRNSGSDTDSDSSDCESDSGNDSRSRSKSPVGSGSGSSSDSESDAASNSKEGSDEEVDIMTSDDDKGPKDNLQASDPELSTSPSLCRPNGLQVPNLTIEKEDLHASEIIKITENSRNYAQVAEFDAYNGSVFNDKKGEQHPQVIKPSSDDCAVPQGTEFYRGDLHIERDDFRYEEFDSCQRKLEGKSKKRSYEKQFDDNDMRSKKVKAGIMTRAPMQIEDGYNNEKRPPRNPRDGAVDQNLTPTDSHHQKGSELPGKIIEVGSVLNSRAVNPSKDNNISEVDRSPIINGRDLNLRRESSELELGELRDPLPEETTGIKKQSDKKGSIKQSLTSFDYCNPDISKGRPAGRTGVDRINPSSADLSDICKDPPLLDGRVGGKKNSGTFFDNNKFLYCKYEKDKPELKGPIKDHSQYMECVKEYQEKYDSYLSINKILDSERNEFLKFGRDLEAAKEKDMIKYYSILEELKESYRQCGTRHKRLKKVYLVLYKELKTLKEVIQDYANHYRRA